MIFGGGFRSGIVLALFSLSTAAGRGEESHVGVGQKSSPEKNSATEDGTEIVPPAFEGKYRMMGVSPGGDSYQNDLTITRDRANWVAEWRSDPDSEWLRGSVLTLDGRAALGYTGEKMVALGLYRIDGNRLTGPLLFPDYNPFPVFHELRMGKSLEDGLEQPGRVLPGKVELKPTETPDRFDASWDAGGKRTLHGIAVKKGDFLAVVFGADPEAVKLLALFEKDETLWNGVWGSTLEPGLGTETLAHASGDAVPPPNLYLSLPVGGDMWSLMQSRSSQEEDIRELRVYHVLIGPKADGTQKLSAMFLPGVEATPIQMIESIVNARRRGHAIEYAEITSTEEEALSLTLRKENGRAELAVIHTRNLPGQGMVVYALELLNPDGAATADKFMEVQRERMPYWIQDLPELSKHSAELFNTTRKENLPATGQPAPEKQGD